MVNINRCYQILGLKPDASLEDLKQAYRQLAKTWHPDRYKGDPQLTQQAEEQFRKITEAYQLLREHFLEPQSARQTHTFARQSTPEAFYERGTEHAQAGEYEDAVREFSIAIRLNPNYAEAYRYRGFVRSLLGLELAAASDLAKATELGLRKSYASTSPPGWDKSDSVKTQAQTNYQTSPKVESEPVRQAEIPLTPAPWKCTQTFKNHTDAIASVAISPNGKVLGSGSWDSTINLFNLWTGQVFCTFTGHSEPVWTVTFTQDSQMLASGSRDGTIKLWHINSASLLRTLTGHTEGVRSITISSDRKFLVSGSWDGSVKFWNLLNGKLLHSQVSYNDPFWAVTISPDGNTVFASGQSGVIKLYHLKTGELLRTFVGDSGEIYAIAVSPDGKKLVSSGKNGKIQIWAIATGKAEKTVMIDSKAVSSVVFTPDGRILVSGHEDGQIIFWDLPSGKPLYILTGHQNTVTSLALTKDSQTLVSGSLDKTIKVWYYTNL
jgi:WD40 repeat protein